VPGLEVKQARQSLYSVLLVNLHLDGFLRARNPKTDSKTALLGSEYISEVDNVHIHLIDSVEELIGTDSYVHVHQLTCAPVSSVCGLVSCMRI